MITCRAVNYKLHGVNNIKEDHRVLDVFCKTLLIVIIIVIVIIIIVIIIIFVIIIVGPAKFPCLLLFYLLVFPGIIMYFSTC